MGLGGTTAGSQYDRIDTSGQLVLAGVLDVELIDGFMPQAGESFELFNGDISGRFSQLSLPALDSGLTWDTSDLYTTGTISVVPEPSTLVLLTIAAVGLAGYRSWRHRTARTCEATGLRTQAMELIRAVASAPCEWIEAEAADSDWMRLSKTRANIYTKGDVIMRRRRSGSGGR